MPPSVASLPPLPRGNAVTLADAADLAAATVDALLDTPLRVLLDQARVKGEAAERARIFARPVTQRFETDDCLLHCAGCQAGLEDGVMTHEAGCSEMRLDALLTETRESTDG